MQNPVRALSEPPARGEATQVSVADNSDAVIAGEGQSLRLPGLRNSTPGPNGRVAETLIKKILVPTNFAGSSAKAVERAVAIASQCCATMTILHVIDINAQTKCGGADQLMKRLWEEGSARMGQLAWSLRGQVEAQTRLEEGLPWDKIVERSRDFDLLILGKGRCKTGWKPFSQHTAQRVIEKAACPVMVVHEN
jgi:nucleotide-binding universal stress UspA family protein